MERLIVTPNEARVMLRISTAEMYRLLKDGIIPSFRRGNRWFIVKADLMQYINNLSKKERRT